MAAARVLPARLEHINTSVSHRPREGQPMAASIPIEQESGMSAGHVHSHNGYFAGVFASPRYAPPGESPASSQSPVQSRDD